MHIPVFSSLLSFTFTIPHGFLTHTYDSPPPLLTLTLTLTIHYGLHSAPTHATPFILSYDSLSEESSPRMKSWLTSPTVIPKRIVLLMESTVARQLTKTVMVNVSGLVTPANSATVAVAVAIDSHAETLITEVIVSMKIAIGLVMVYAAPRVDPATEAAETLLAEVIVSMKIVIGLVVYAVPLVDPATEIAETLIAGVIVSTSIVSG